MRENYQYSKRPPQTTYVWFLPPQHQQNAITREHRIVLNTTVYQYSSGAGTINRLFAQHQQNELPTQHRIQLNDRVYAYQSGYGYVEGMDVRSLSELDEALQSRRYVDRTVYRYQSGQSFVRQGPAIEDIVVTAEVPDGNASISFPQRNSQFYSLDFQRKQKTAAGAFNQAASVAGVFVFGNYWPGQWLTNPVPRADVVAPFPDETMASRRVSWTPQLQYNPGQWRNNSLPAESLGELDEAITSRRAIDKTVYPYQSGAGTITQLFPQHQQNEITPQHRIVLNTTVYPYRSGAGTINWLFVQHQQNELPTQHRIQLNDRVYAYQSGYGYVEGMDVRSLSELDEAIQSRRWIDRTVYPYNPGQWRNNSLPTQSLDELDEAVTSRRVIDRTTYPYKSHAWTQGIPQSHLDELDEALQSRRSIDTTVRQYVGAAWAKYLNISDQAPILEADETLVSRRASWNAKYSGTPVVFLSWPNNVDELLPSGRRVILVPDGAYDGGYGQWNTGLLEEGDELYQSRRRFDTTVYP